MPKKDAHGVQPDDSGEPDKEGRQIASQSWIIKNVLSKNVCLTFASACVKTVKVSAEDGATGQKELKFDHSVPSMKVKFNVRTADAEFSFGHCRGPA